MSTSFPAPATRRIAAIACVVLGTLGATASTSPVHGQVKPLGSCTLRPSVDSMPLGDALLDAWRVRDGMSEILHDVRCSDGRTARVWIAATFI